MDFLKDKAKKAALEKGRELFRKLDENASSNATSGMDGSQKSPNEALDPAKAEQLHVEQHLSAVLDDSESVSSIMWFRNTQSCQELIECNGPDPYPGDADVPHTNPLGNINNMG